MARGFCPTSRKTVHGELGLEAHRGSECLISHRKQDVSLFLQRFKADCCLKWPHHFQLSRCCMSPTSHSWCKAVQENRREFLDTRNFCHVIKCFDERIDGDGALDTGAMKGRCWVYHKTRALPFRVSALPFCKKCCEDVRARDRQPHRRPEHRGEHCKAVHAKEKQDMCETPVP